MEVKQVFPLFEEGRILKRDALDCIRDYAPDFCSLLFQDYGSGVVAGFQIGGVGTEITVSPGILKHGLEFFCMKEAVTLQYNLFGQTVMVILKKRGGMSTADFRTDYYELSLEPVRALQAEEYELGRFLLEQGARLRTYEDYKDFHDLVTGFNTLNPIYIRFACEGGSTLAPFILRLYGKGVLHSAKAQPLDLSFGVACLNSRVVSAELIRQYLSVQEPGRDEGQSNLHLYQRLDRLYTRLVSGGEARHRSGGISGRGKTLID